MSQQPATLFPAPPAAIEPDWLRDIRRRDANLTTTQARTAPHDRRALLKAYDEQARRLTELESQLQQARSFTFDLTEEVGALQTQLAAARQELAEQASKHGELRGQVTAMLEDFANGCVAVKMEPGKETTPYWMGVNTERHNNLKWAELKAKELGIAWPIKPTPYKGDLPTVEPAAPTLVGDETPAPILPILTQGHPNATQQKALRERAPAVGSIWQKKGDPSEQVIICESTRWDSVALRRHPLASNSDFNRLRYKKEHYFLYEYEQVGAAASLVGEKGPAA